MQTFIQSLGAGFREHWRTDALSGFLVFLVALPLCFGIAMASGFPPMAGVISAVVGGLLVSRINGSPLAVVGPAAGLIAVLYTAVQTLGEGDAWAGYRYTLAATVVAGGLQLVLARYRAGHYASFFPSAVAHGMLAAIGIIILSRQLHILIGAQPAAAGPLANLALLPQSLGHFDPVIALIGGLGLLALFAWPQLGNRVLGRIPAPVVAVAVGLWLGQSFRLDRAELYVFAPGPHFLADIPDRFWEAMVLPDFSKLATPAFWSAVAGIFLIGSLETLLVAVAVDKLDPEKREIDLNKDIGAIGIGNMVSGMLGGMPMIVEIVRSSANIGYGARSGWSNFFHGLFMLLFMILFPHVLRGIPQASLAALLVYAGLRLASPQVFAERLELGRAQLGVFLVTIVAILATDLLIGIAIGIAAKLLVHRWQGVQFEDLFQLDYRVYQEADGAYRIAIGGAAVFSNILTLKGELAALPAGGHVVFDLARASLVDHTAMECLESFRHEYSAQGGRCDVLGLDWHEASSDHPLATRRRREV